MPHHTGREPYKITNQERDKASETSHPSATNGCHLKTRREFCQGKTVANGTSEGTKGAES